MVVRYGACEAACCGPDLRVAVKEDVAILVRQQGPELRVLFEHPAEQRVGHRAERVERRCEERAAHVQLHDRRHDGGRDSKLQKSGLTANFQKCGSIVARFFFFFFLSFF